MAQTEAQQAGKRYFVYKRLHHKLNLIIKTIIRYSKAIFIKDKFVLLNPFRFKVCKTCKNTGNKDSSKFDVAMNYCRF
jgi:hypothetical protein